MSDKAAARGVEKPEGPGWWLASDGKYYPPELSADARAKKKVAKKKAPAAKKSPAKKKAPTAKKSPAKKKAPAAKKSPAKKKVPVEKKHSVAAKKSAAKKDALAAKSEAPTPSGSPAADPVGDGDIGQRSGQLKFTAHPPPTDQIAARQIQAKEQGALLSVARQRAALRALSSLGDEEPVLVGAGARSLDARSGATAPMTPDIPAAPEARVEPTATPATPGPSSGGPTAPPVAPRAPAQAPALPDEPVEPVEPPDKAVPVTADDSRADVGTVATTPSAPDPVPRSLVPPDVQHAPDTRPAPTAEPMGTDVPFMEVKGSALATDIDRIGEKILIFADRVELRDRGNSLTRTIRYDQLTGVEVQKKIMGPTLLINTADGKPMSAKALRPELASGAKAMIEKHAKRFRAEPQTVQQDTPLAPSSAALAANAVVVEPAGAARLMTPGVESPVMVATPEPERVAPPVPDPDLTPAPRPMPHPTHKHVLVGMLEELHAAGILDADELDSKKSLVERNDRH